MEKGKKAVLILGMHRSGTSGIAGALAQRGLFFGENLIPADTDNPKGYFEDAEIVRIHEKLLADLHCDWKTPFKLPTDWLVQTATQQAEEELNRYLEGHFSLYECIGIKDPRLCILLPLWRKILARQERRMQVVMVLRNPADVAASLAKRNALPLELGTLLWLEYTTAALRDLPPDAPLQITDFLSVLVHEEEETNRLLEALGWPWGKPEGEMQPWLERRLIHPAQTVEGDGGMFHTMAHRLYMTVLENKKNQSRIPVAIDDIAKTVGTIERCLRDAVPLFQDYREDTCQLYYSFTGKFTEEDSLLKSYRRGACFGPSIGIEDISGKEEIYLRIDPSVYPGHLSISDIRIAKIDQVGEETGLLINTRSLKAGGDLAVMSVGSDGGLQFVVTGPDPMIFLPPIVLHPNIHRIRLDFKLHRMVGLEDDFQFFFTAWRSAMDQLKTAGVRTDALSHEKSQLKEALQSRETKLRATEKESAMLRESLMLRGGELECLAREKASLEAELKHREEALHLLETDVKTMRLRMDLHEKQKDAFCHEITGLREGLALNKQRVLTLEQEYAAINEHVTGLTAERDALSGKYSVALNKTLIDGEKIHNLESALEASESLRGRYKDELKAACKSLDEIKRSHLWRLGFPVRAINRMIRNYFGGSRATSSNLQGPLRYSVTVNPQEAEANVFLVEGWCFDNKGMPAEKITVQYAEHEKPVSPVERPDVDVYFKDQRLKSQRVGFVVRSKFYYRPTRLIVTARTGGEDVVLMDVHIRQTISNVLAYTRGLRANLGLPLRHPATGRLKPEKVIFNLEAPVGKLFSIRSNPVRIAGWVFDEAGEVPVRVMALIGDRTVNLDSRISRADVRKAFSQYPALSDLSGFDGTFRTGYGFRLITVIAEWADGSRYLLTQKIYWLTPRMKSGSGRILRKTRRFHRDRNITLRNLYREQIRSSERIFENKKYPPAVDIIIPVYRGLEETRLCLSSVYASRSKNTTPFEIIVVEDQSPEPELVNYLESEAAAGRITLLKNKENLGFVGTVNRGMCLNPKRDVILLNSDTEVYNGWVDRICAAGKSDACIATVTPFSNNATICSYPECARDNKLPSNVSPNELDRFCNELNAGIIHEIPTGVGFCMYIKRASLDALGYFDQGVFGKGYGEENDFCQRAILEKWKNVLLCDTFVYHKGAVSFGGTKNPKIDYALLKLSEFYPTFDSQVRNIISRDPFAAERLRLDEKRLTLLPENRILAISNERGGGTLQHIIELAKYSDPTIARLLLTPAKGRKEAYDVRFLPEMTRINYPPEGLTIDQVSDFCRKWQIRSLELHHLADHSQDAFSIPTKTKLPYRFIAHDYFSYCPQITLTDSAGNYCGEPDITACERCLSARPSHGIKNVAEWRAANRLILEAATEVTCPSVAAATHLAKHFPDARFVVTPHRESDLEAISLDATWPNHLAGRPLTVGILGAISREKGADLIEDAAIDAVRRNLPVRFVLLGYAYRTLLGEPEARLTVTGAYKNEEIDHLIAAHKPDIFWFPARWPETYSYTLSIALQRRFPVIVPNLGAFPARVKGRKLSWVLNWDISAYDLNNHLTEILAQSSIDESNNPLKNNLCH